MPVNEDIVKYFGFAVETDKGVKVFYKYKIMPFGLNDAARVLTKLMRSPLERWWAMGIKCYIHLDDVFVFCGSKEETIEASRRVWQDLIDQLCEITPEKIPSKKLKMIHWQMKLKDCGVKNVASTSTPTLTYKRIFRINIF